VYVGTLLPTGTDTLRALFAGIERLRHSAPPLAGRLRLRFVGTSNQRSIGPAPRVLPIAREFGLEEIVTEEPSRLDYFDAMQALVESDAVLLLGSREPHYTPSKVFPALLSERPLLALCHEASPVVELLRRVGGPPAIRLVTYGDRRPVREEADVVAAALREMLADRGWPHRSLDFRPLESTSAHALAGRLAGLLDALQEEREVKTCVRSA
jgi:hypothetical protein